MKKIYALSVIAICASSLFSIPRPPDVKLKEPPTLENKESFSMILFGDPQTYGKYKASQPIFELMTAWTAAHKDELNIKAALCTGDLVEKNDIAALSFYGKRVSYDTPSEDMWQSVARAFSRLDGEIPYILCTGNHDYGFYSAENRNSNFGKYFPILKNPCWQKCLVSTSPNANNQNTLENAAYQFEDKNWGKILVIALEFAPRDVTLEWAKKLTTSNNYKNHKVIILTHSILRTRPNIAEVIKTEKYKLPEPNWGEAVLKKLVDKSDNIKLVLCGHSGTPKRIQSNIVYKNEAGRDVHVVMFNPQSEGGWFGNGGDGWLRIMEFYPDGKTISMRTYSPLFGASMVTQDYAWNKSKDAQFKIELQ